MMCLSCHDGNIAKGAMMTNKSYEQAQSLLPAGLYGTLPIPTLLGNDGTTAGNYYNDHPIGPQATLGAVGVASNFQYTPLGCGGGKFDCLTIKASATAYLAFAGHYGQLRRTEHHLQRPQRSGSFPGHQSCRMRTCFAPRATPRTACTLPAPMLTPRSPD